MSDQPKRPRILTKMVIEEISGVPVGAGIGVGVKFKKNLSGDDLKRAFLDYRKSATLDAKEIKKAKKLAKDEQKRITKMSNKFVTVCKNLADGVPQANAPSSLEITRKMQKRADKEYPEIKSAASRFAMFAKSDIGATMLRASLVAKDASIEEMENDRDPTYDRMQRLREKKKKQANRMRSLQAEERCGGGESSVGEFEKNLSGRSPDISTLEDQDQTEDEQSNADGLRAYKQLMAIANNKRLEGESLTSAFARVYSDPRYQGLVMRSRDEYLARVSKSFGIL